MASAWPAAEPVGIVGGGLGGLALALGLERLGLPWRLFERAPALRDESQGSIVIWPNGMKALAAIHPELPGAMLARGAEKRDTIIESRSHGAEWKKQRMQENTTEAFGQPCVFVAWREVQRALMEMLPRGDGRVVCGQELVGVEETGSSTTLHFAGGRKETVRLAVGCDGAFSSVRRALGSDVKPQYFGQLNWASIIDSSALKGSVLHEDDGNVSVIIVEEPPMDIFLIGIGHQQVFWQLRMKDESMQQALSGNNGRGGLGLPGTKDRLLELLAGHPDLAGYIAATSEAKIFERSIYDCEPLERWSSPGRRVVLLGDAAHCMHSLPGQGANFTFEDVAELLACLTSEPGVEAAVTCYEANRIPRATAMQQRARLAGTRQKELSPDEKQKGMAKMQEERMELFSWRPRPVMLPAVSRPRPAFLQLRTCFAGIVKRTYGVQR